MGRLYQPEAAPAGARRPGVRGLWPWVLVAGAVTSLMAEISINPFGTAFRFSLGPVALAFFALFYPLLPAYLTGLVTGAAVPLVHGAFALLEDRSLPVAGLAGVAAGYLPETLAYSVLGLLMSGFRVHERTHAPVPMAALLGAADFLANAVELAVRPEPVYGKAFAVAALVASGRAAVAAGAFYVLQEGVREREWAQERRRYRERLLFLANLQTETFFLQKSAREIEQVMAKAHSLYRELEGHPRQPLALEIATEIHEVKKDYQRTVTALGRLVELPPLAPEMTLREIVAMVVEANQAYAASLGKQIAFPVDLAADFSTPRFGRWVSILNNLVTNGVEACGSQGTVAIAAQRLGGHLVLWVSDTGGGIPRKNWDLVFSPGFSTKWNPVTGAFSSGIGLTHVAALVHSMQGRIEIRQSGPGGTVFRLQVPWEALEAS